MSGIEKLLAKFGDMALGGGDTLGAMFKRIAKERPGTVTEDAVKNTVKRFEAGENPYYAAGEETGLGMSHAERMGRGGTRGFDKGAYHGTPEDYFAYDLSSGNLHVNDDSGLGIFTTTSPSEANYFVRRQTDLLGSRADDFVPGATVLPLRMRVRSPEVYDTQADLRAALLDAPYSREGPGVALYEQLSGRGADGVIVRNSQMEHGAEGGRWYIPFEEHQVRSPHAAFDPAHKDTPYLLSGKVPPIAVGAGAGAASAQDDVEQYADGGLVGVPMTGWSLPSIDRTQRYFDQERRGAEEHTRRPDAQLVSPTMARAGQRIGEGIVSAIDNMREIPVAYMRSGAEIMNPGAFTWDDGSPVVEKASVPSVLMDIATPLGGEAAGKVGGATMKEILSRWADKVPAKAAGAATAAGVAGTPSEADAMFIGPSAKSFLSGSKFLTKPIRGLEGSMMRELSDAGAQITPEGIALAKALYGRDDAVKLPDLLSHRALYREYPELRDVTVEMKPLDRGTDRYFGMQFPGENKLALDTKAIDELSEFPRSQSENTLLHEIQHWIQEKEGWSPGTNRDYWKPDTDSATRAYREIQDVDKADSIMKEYKRLLETTELSAGEARQAARDWADNMWGEKYTQKAFDLLDDWGAATHPVNSPFRWPNVDFWEKQYPALQEKNIDLLHRWQNHNAGAAHDPYQAYMNTYGEQLARATEARRGLNTLERQVAVPEILTNPPEGTRVIAPRVKPTYVIGDE